MSASTEQKSKFLSAASSAFLKEKLPLNFTSLDLDEQAKLLETNNAITLYRNLADKSLLEMIENHAVEIEKSLKINVPERGNFKKDDRFFVIKIEVGYGDYKETDSSLVVSDSKENAIQSAFEDRARETLVKLHHVENYTATDGDSILTLKYSEEVCQFEASVFRKHNF